MACHFDDEGGARLNDVVGQEICYNLEIFSPTFLRFEMTGADNVCHW